ncbi:MAG: molybdenum cofactor guanylyltransferase MobA [Arenicellales bacterium WSBS_2016_MAG_OTU3]
MTQTASLVTAVVLAGGRARRMGGQDKGLLDIAGQMLVEHITTALEPQVDHIAINANRNVEQYAALGYPVWQDVVDDFQGPLAGMLTALKKSTDAFVLTLPCDGPIVASDLVWRMLAQQRLEDSDIVVAHNGERLQPVYCLLRTALVESLSQFLQSGERKIDNWFSQHGFAVCDFSDNPDMFLNANTPEELTALEGKLKRS